MNCIVTAGPTFEKMDQVRRLTNFSTGRLGTMLASYLSGQGHRVTLLRGHYSTYRGEQKAEAIIEFTTPADLREKLGQPDSGSVDAVYHAAAVGDFFFGRIFSRTAAGNLEEIRVGKLSSRAGPLLAELMPAPKIIAELRGLFPGACLVGWKFEVEGGRDSVLALGRTQIADNGIDGCVANGPAYGAGYGLLTAGGQEPGHFEDERALFAALEKLAMTRKCH